MLAQTHRMNNKKNSAQAVQVNKAGAQVATKFVIERKKKYQFSFGDSLELLSLSHFDR